MSDGTRGIEPDEAIRAVRTELYIGGEWRDASGGALFPVENPATGEVIAHVADATPDDGMAALTAAAEAQDDWAATAPRRRAELLSAAFDLITARSEEFATVMTMEMGKPLAQARGEVAYGAEFLRWFSEEAPRVAGRYAPVPEGTSRLLTVKRPVGPALLITPWNFPLAMGTRKVAPALAAGCTVVIKPAQATPLTTHLLVQVLHEVGVPAGVVNLVSTSSASAVTGPLLRDPRLRKVSFTGSTEVGRRLLVDAAQNVLRTSMELGGNAPFLVFADADLDAAVAGAMAAKLRNMGEACAAANRFYVEQPVAEEFSARLAEKMAKLTIGNGLDDGTDIGPLIDAGAVDKVDELVRDALARGATAVTGGEAVGSTGHFYRPTVLSGVSRDSRVLSEEIFGPVAPVVPFSTEDEAVRLANDTEFGLVAYAYTTDMKRGLRLIERLDTGMMGLNTGVISNAAAPFGGIKQSGLGREGGHEGIEEYLSTKYVGLVDPFA